MAFMRGGFDDTFGPMPDLNEDRPAMPPMLRSSETNMSSLGPALAGMKSMTLAEAPRMPPMAKGALKKVPLLGSVYTGAQTTMNNPANLTPTGAMLHGFGTGALSALTPPPIALGDAVTGNHLGNAQEDLVGAMLKPLFGKEKK